MKLCSFCSQTLVKTIFSGPGTFMMPNSCCKYVKISNSINKRARLQTHQNKCFLSTYFIFIFLFFRHDSFLFRNLKPHLHSCRWPCWKQESKEFLTNILLVKMILKMTPRTKKLIKLLRVKLLLSTSYWFNPNHYRYD